MKQAISKKILKMMGWKIVNVIPDVPKCVICVAPHTSNWDFIIGKLFYNAVGRNASFLIKKEWFIFPFSLIFKKMGGVPVDRGKRTSVTDQMVERFKTMDVFQLAITPEGTRKPAKDWKKGFYFIAEKANVPILMAFLDYGTKEVGFKGGIFHPTGDADADIRTIRTLYNDVTARHPENFVKI